MSRTHYKLRAMHALYGRDPEHTCRSCCNYKDVPVLRRRRIWCAAYGSDPGQDTKWSPDYVACGRYGRPLFLPERPLLYKLTRKNNAPAAGQMKLEV